jgi:hypothetical protein
MIYMLLGYLHAAVFRRVREIRRLAGEAGQGTVEYVGLILLVALLMVGMVAAMKGFNRYFGKTSYPKYRGSSGGNGKAARFRPALFGPMPRKKVERPVALRRPKPPRFPGPPRAPCI